MSGNETDEDRISAALSKGLLNLSSEELQTLKSDLEGRGIRVYNSLTPEQLVLIAAASVYSRAFLEALAKRHADRLADWLERRRAQDALPVHDGTRLVSPRQVDGEGQDQGRT